MTETPTADAEPGTDRETMALAAHDYADSSCTVEGRRLYCDSAADPDHVYIDTGLGGDHQGCPVVIRRIVRSSGPMSTAPAAEGDLYLCLERLHPVKYSDPETLRADQRGADSRRYRINVTKRPSLLDDLIAQTPVGTPPEP